jgi:hypothetical protein
MLRVQLTLFEHLYSFSAKALKYLGPVGNKNLFLGTVLKWYGLPLLLNAGWEYSVRVSNGQSVLYFLCTTQST